MSDELEASSTEVAEPTNGRVERFRAELNRLLKELRHLDEQVTHDDTQIQIIAQSNETAQRLMTIPGIGALIATALMAAVGEDEGQGVSQRTRPGRLAGAGPATAFHRRTRALAWDQQAL